MGFSQGVSAMCDWSLGRWLSGKQRDTSDVVLLSHVLPIRASSGSVAKSRVVADTSVEGAEGRENPVWEHVEIEIHH